MTMEKTKIFAIMGKAGSGKDTILRKVMDGYSNKFHEIVSCTTRPPREGEQHGVNYYFLSIEEFTEKVLNGDMLEATLFNDWHYGTMRTGLSRDKINIGVFNPDGVRALLENDEIDVTVFYVRAGAKQRLLRQLNREENPDVQEIIRRFSADEEDFGDLEDIREFIPLQNESLEDLDYAVKIIGWAD